MLNNDSKYPKASVSIERSFLKADHGVNINDFSFRLVDLSVAQKSVHLRFIFSVELKVSMLQIRGKIFAINDHSSRLVNLSLTQKSEYFQFIFRIELKMSIIRIWKKYL